MAHSTQIQGYTFIHNGDYSGDVVIMPPFSGVPQLNTPAVIGQSFVPFSALAEFVAGYVVGERIAALENAATLDVLLGKI